MRQPAWIFNKVDWYRRALRNLGFLSLVRLQLHKRFGSRRVLNNLTSGRLAYPVLARGRSSDFLVFEQIFVNMEYQHLEVIKNPRLILDCGANVGYSAAYFLSKYSECFVIAVEPDPDNFAILVKNLAPYRGRYKLIQAALWPRNERLRFVSRTRRSGDEWGRVVGRALPEENEPEEINAVDLPTLLRDSRFDRISILKVDIEGSEVELFAADPHVWLDQVDNIAIELHGTESSRLFFNVVGSRPYDIYTCGDLTICLRRDEVVPVP